MTARRARPLALALVAVALPAPAAAQTQRQDIMHQIRVVEAEIAELEGMQNRILHEGHVAVISGASGAILSREQAESLMVWMLLEKNVDPRGVAEYARQVGLATRIYLREHIEPELEAARGLRAELYRRLQRATDGPSVAAPPPPSDLAGPWAGVRARLVATYEIRCPSFRSLGGNVELDLTGDGKVAARFLDQDGIWTAPGEIDAEGVALGRADRGNDDLLWRLELRKNGSITLQRGIVWLYPGGQNVCSMGSIAGLRSR